MMPENFRDVLITKLNEEESLPLTHDAMLAALDEFESAAEKQEGDDVWEHYEDAEQVWGIFLQYIKDSNMEEDVPEPIESEEPSEEETPKPKKKAKKESPSVEAEQEDVTPAPKKKNPKKKPVKEEAPEPKKDKEEKKPKNSKKEKEAPEPKKNSKKDVPKKPKKDKEEKKPSVDRPGVVKAIVDKLKEGWTTKKDVHEHLCEEFSDRDPDKMKNTIQTQIHHKDMLHKKWNVEVKKGEGNEKLYRIKGAAK